MFYCLKIKSLHKTHCSEFLLTLFSHIYLVQLLFHRQGVHSHAWLWEPHRQGTPPNPQTALPSCPAETHRGACEVAGDTCPGSKRLLNLYHTMQTTVNFTTVWKPPRCLWEFAPGRHRRSRSSTHFRPPHKHEPQNQQAWTWLVLCSLNQSGGEVYSLAGPVDDTRGRGPVCMVVLTRYN